MASESPVRIAISVGDPNGIGIEVALKAILNGRAGGDSTAGITNSYEPLLFGPVHAIRRHAEKLGLGRLSFADVDLSGDVGSVSCGVQDVINVVDVEAATGARRDIGGPFEPSYGAIDARAGDLAMCSVKMALEYCLNKQATALVTAPISKESIRLAGYSNPGHTEYLASACRAASHCMMMVDGAFRVALVTTHVPLSNVTELLTINRILEKAHVLNQSLRRDFAVTGPRIAVLGVNPHAGEAGTIGGEEKTVITPAIRAMQEAGICAEGPFPADGFFGMAGYRDYDAVLAMYHDQGLIPFKMLAFDTGVNFTAGLSVVRTSPDHGTAFDIAGNNNASSISMERALERAVEIVANRSRSTY